MNKEICETQIHQVVKKNDNLVDFQNHNNSKNMKQIINVNHQKNNDCLNIDKNIVKQNHVRDILIENIKFKNDRITFEKLSNIKLCPSIIGKGGGGVVYLGIKNYKKYAIKFIFNPDGLQRKDLKSILENSNNLLKEENLKFISKLNHSTKILKNPKLENIKNNINEETNFDSKIINYSEINTRILKNNYQTIKNECEITSNLKNKNTVKSFGVFHLDYYNAIIMEFCSNMDLGFLVNLHYSGKLNKNQIHHSIVLQEKSDPEKEFPWLYYISESFIRFFFNQILNALEYLSIMKYVHHDLKLENFLINSNYNIKLSDFALCTKVNLSQPYYLNQKGSINYMSPDLFNKTNKIVDPKNAFKIDYFALGVCLYKMATNKYFFKKNEEIEYESYKIKIDELMFSKESAFGDRLKNELISDEFYDLVKNLTHPEIENRLDFEHIKNHKWNNIKINDSVNFYFKLHETDFMKFLIELNKIEYSKFLSQRINDENLFELVEEDLEIKNDFSL